MLVIGKEDMKLELLIVAWMWDSIFELRRNHENELDKHQQFGEWKT